MDSFNLMHVRAAIDVATKVLAHRVQRLIALTMTFSLFCWAMGSQSWLHYIVAGTFGLTIFLPILVATRDRGELENGQ